MVMATAKINAKRKLFIPEQTTKAAGRTKARTQTMVEKLGPTSVRTEWIRFALITEAILNDCVDLRVMQYPRHINKNV